VNPQITGCEKYETGVACVAVLRAHLDNLTLMLDRNFEYASHKPIKPRRRATLEAQADAIGTAIELLTHNGNYSRERHDSLARVRRGTTPAPAAAKTAAEEYGAFRIAWRAHDGVLHHGGEDQEWNEARATAAADKLTRAGFVFAGATGDINQRGAAWIEHQDPETKEWRQW